MGSIWVEPWQRSGSACEQGGGASGYGGARRLGVLGEDRRREVARELREREAKLFAWSIWAEQLWNGGATAGWSSSEFKRGGDAVLGRGVEELAKERREKKEGVLLVLMRAKGEGGGL